MNVSINGTSNASIGVAVNRVKKKLANKFIVQLLLKHNSNQIVSIVPKIYLQLHLFEREQRTMNVLVSALLFHISYFSNPF